MEFELQAERSSIIKVIGVGGGGSNAVNHMYSKGIKDVNFVVCNTDSQALNNSPVALKLQLGENLYSETDASGAATQGNPTDNGLGSLRQNFLEASNVQPVNELIDLIQTQRAFELNSQMVQAGDQMLQLVANLRRG